MIHYYNYRPKQSTADRNTGTTAGKRRHPARKFFKWLLIGLLLVISLLILVGSAGYFYISRVPLDNQSGRTNILVLGIDEVANLSDTIMVVSLFEQADSPPKAVFTSIPRDLYVEIPGFGGNKINAAHAFGEQHNYPGGGPALTMETLNSELGIPVHYYAALSFDSFETIIDAFGGITIESKIDINDPFYPAPGYRGYEPFLLEAGIHHMDGGTALKYARSRQTTNDFDRAFRQQQIVLAVRDELMKTAKDYKNYGHTARLLKAFEQSVETDMTRIELLKLGAMSRNLESNDVAQYVIDTTNFLTGTTNHAGNVLIPRTGNFQDIRNFLDKIFDQDGVDQFSQTRF